MHSIHRYLAISLFVLASGLTFADNHTDGEQGTPSDQIDAITSDMASASAPSENKPSSSQKLPPDIRTIIDISGSMKKTDPNNLRAPAMRLLVDLLPKDSKSGVWTFGQYVNMLVKHRVIDDGWKKEAKEKSNDISSVGLFTNIGDAMNTAGYDLDRLKPEYEPFFILLTDGMVDINKDPDVNKQEQDRILKELVPKFADAGVKLHTIALSDKADQDFLKQLSLSTGGMSTVAKSSDELLKAFVRLFDQSVPSEEVPLEDNKFLIDSSIEEFTALIFRKEGSQATQLVAPDESVINADSGDPDVTWHTDTQYDLITVKRPYEGEWILQAEADPDNRVTVVSDLTLQLEDIPPTIFSGEEIDVHAWFDSADGQVKEAEFLSLLDGTLQLTNEAGKSIQKEIAVQTEGEYQHGFYEKIRNLRRPGEFEISILVDGKTFKRQRSHRVEVLEPMAYDVSYDGVGDESLGIVSATPLLEGLDLEKTQVIAKVKAPDDSSLIASAELQLSQDGQKWVVQVVPTKGQGTYRVSLDLNLALETGKQFRIKPKPFDLQLPYFPEGYIAPEPEPEPMETIKPKMDEKKLSMPEETTSVADAMPETEPKPEEPKEDNLFIFIMLAVLGLVASILGFLFYKLRSQKRIQAEIGSEEAGEGELSAEMGELSELDSGELSGEFDESPELSDQVDSVREELERMGGVPDDEENNGISDDTPPDLEQDELISALDELSGNETELDADDMVDEDFNDAPAEDIEDAFEPVPDEDESIEDSIDKELDALLEETESELDAMTESQEEEDIPTLDEAVDEDSEPELEVGFDSNSMQEDAEEPLTDEALTEDTASDSDFTEEDLPEDVSLEDIPEITETVETDDDLDVDDSMDDDDLLDELSSDDELIGGDQSDESDIDEFGESIDQALDELLADADQPETTEEFDIDDLDDLDSELDALTKDLEEEAFGAASESAGSVSTEDSVSSDDSVSNDDSVSMDDLDLEEEQPQTDQAMDVDDASLDELAGSDAEAPLETVSDELEDLLAESEASQSGSDESKAAESEELPDDELSSDLSIDNALEEALGQLDDDDGMPLDDALAALEDISPDELDAPDDGEVDIDRIMAEIDAEAIRQNQENKDS